MRSKHILPVAAALCLLSICSCNNNTEEHNNPPNDTSTAPSVKVPDFNSDSAYASVQAQVAFGPRVPASKTQLACASWMQRRLESFCDTVYRQDASVRAGDGQMLPCFNIIGIINPKAQRRVLLLTHWDSRPWADRDTKDKDKPIEAADDAASGVAVLIEVARVLKEHPLPEGLGVDILLEDVEDYGKTEWGDDSYCLGTQYWAHHPHVANYHAEFGILLDMVGARDASFPLEQLSKQFAGDVQQRVWAAAGRAGYSSYFTYGDGGGITDDHKYVNELTHIPTIDIINLDNSSGTGFARHWHTHNDNMSIIDKNTLKAVGQTLLQVLFETATTDNSQ